MLVQLRCLNVNKISNEVSVTLYPTHYGHEVDVQFLRLSFSERVEIASKLKSGLSIDQVYDEIRESGLRAEHIERCQKRIFVILKKHLDFEPWKSMLMMQQA